MRQQRRAVHTAVAERDSRWAGVDPTDAEDERRRTGSFHSLSPTAVLAHAACAGSLCVTLHCAFTRAFVAPQTFSVESLLNGRIDVLSLLHYLHEKQHTGVRDLLTNMLYDLELVEIDSILPQLIHLSVKSTCRRGETQAPAECSDI